MLNISYGLFLNLLTNILSHTNRLINGEVGFLASFTKVGKGSQLVYMGCKLECAFEFSV